MKGKLLAILGAIGLTASLAGLTSCDSGPTVRVGLHTNLGAGAGYSAYAQGYAEEEGFTMEVNMGTGPNLASALISGEIDVSYMGNGVAWNYFSENSAITMVALDNLTDDDRLIAYNGGRGAGLTVDSPVEDLISALRTSTVALDTTATPITFFRSLLSVLNESVTDGNYLWYEVDDGTKYPELDEAYYTTANQVTIVNSTNANIATSAQSGDYDFVVAFAPVSTQLERDTENFTVVAKTSTHMADDYTPSTWAVNTAWKEANEELFYSFMRALVKGMNYRNADPYACLDDIEEVTAGAVLADSLDPNTAVWLSAEQQLELRDSGDDLKYVNNIRESAISGGNYSDVSTVKSIEDSIDFSVLYEICEELK